MPGPRHAEARHAACEEVSLDQRAVEIDGQGVVFNAHYLTYFDTTITEYFRVLGYDQFADAKATGIDFHVVKSLIEYKAPVLSLSLLANLALFFLLDRWDLYKAMRGVILATMIYGLLIVLLLFVL